MTDQLVQSDKNCLGIKSSCEELIQKILQELDAQKEEQSKFKEQLISIIDDNSRICSKIDILESTPKSESAREHDQLTDDAISNLKQQVHHLKEERSTIQLLWKSSQETITNLETEIQNYRNQLFKPSAFTDIKEKYCKAIKALEDIIRNQKCELCKQANTIRDLTDDNNKTNERIKELQAVITEKEMKVSEIEHLEKTNTCLRQQLQIAMQANSELEMSTNLAKSMIDERFIREKNALEKLQEALLIAETAVAEKEEALKRELVIKEECETLATTIGQVMEEAARKVENNIELLKERYGNKEKCLLKKHQETIKELEKQTNAAQAAEARCEMLEQRLRDVIEENNKLDRDLQIASEAIVEMELKLDATKNLLQEDKKSNRICEEREQQIKQYVENNHKLKERWKNTIEDVTKKFSDEIQRLQLENSNLKAEIQCQRLKVNEMDNQQC